MSVPQTVRARRSVRQRMPQGVVLYVGPSLLTGTRIAVVATGLARKSKNPKTGGTVQVYIIDYRRNGKDPIATAKAGKDDSICGDCPHRGQGGKLGSCYVNLIQGPLAVYKALKFGSYPKFSRRKHLHLFADRVVRLGAYGDPAAVPLNVWETILEVAASWTGYTHQWRTCDQALADILMASVETQAQAAQAQMMGWRTFRVRLPDQPVLENEFVCPASEEGGRRMTCERCRACGGATSSPQAASPVVIVHGSSRVPWKQMVYAQTVTRLLEEERTDRLSLPVL
jgi:hypothetical protein